MFVTRIALGILMALAIGCAPAQLQFDRLEQMREVFARATGDGESQTPDVSARPPSSHQLPAVTRPVSYAGYSQEFLEVKRLMAEGRFDEVASRYEQADAKVRKQAKDEKAYVQKTGFLTFVERGTLDLARGDFESAIEDYEGAETVLELRSDQSKFGEAGTKLFRKLKGIVVGKDEFAPYYGVGFERVLLLNGKTIAYVLRGDRKAYNVTRRAIDWQNTEKEKFEAERRETEAKLEEKRKDGDGSVVTAVLNSLTNAYSETEAKATTVPSAFVNPFGYYMSGMIQEFESTQDPSLRSNALISYQKALELNPESPVLVEAVKDMKKEGKRGAGRLVHVVAFDGFAPEKMVLDHQMALPNSTLHVKLPIYEPVSSEVAVIRITSNPGREIASLSLVADIDALSLRHQSDQKSKQSLDVLLTMAQTLGENFLLGDSSGGKAISKWREANRTPDMRSWMSLPSTISAARFIAPESVEEIQIHTYDSKGNELATRSVTLSETGPTFIFVRSIATQMQAYASKGLWFN